jgi:hypothetical protein
MSKAEPQRARRAKEPPLPPAAFDPPAAPPPALLPPPASPPLPPPAVPPLALPPPALPPPVAPPAAAPMLPPLAFAGAPAMQSPVPLGPVPLGPAPLLPAPASPLPVPFTPTQPIGRDSARKPRFRGEPAPRQPAPAQPVSAQPFPIRPAAAPTPVLPGNAPAPLPGGKLPNLAIPAAAADEDAPPDLQEAAVRNAPAFLVSMFVHMLLIIVLALITFRHEIGQQLQLSAIYAETKGEQLIDDKLQSPESLDMEIESPTLSFALTPVNDPLAAPPILTDNVLDANRATSTIEAPAIGLALSGREVGLKKALLPAYGGNATTEAAVVAGLEWLKRQQKSDGGWSLMGPFQDHATMDNRCSATAMALLAFQGYGAKHTPDAGVTPDFHDVVQRGWNYLLKTQDKEGFFVHEGGLNHRLYAQAQATIALCEIYGMTRDAKFKRPAQLALDFAHKAQSPELGGWRYQPREDSDLSVTGWYVMALQSGLMAGLEVQSPNLEMINKFLDSVALEGGAQYCYQPGREASLTMTAEGLLCRQYLGWKHDDPRMRAGIDMVLASPVSYLNDANVYYWYYATQACHHMDGADWNRWNAAMRQAIPAAQSKTGSERGSWNPSADRWGAHGGRLYVTCLSIYMLETYYRHLPIYKWRLQ